MSSLGYNFNSQMKEETRPPKKAMRRAVRNKLINKAIKEGTFLDLDAIYKDGKLFGKYLHVLPDRTKDYVFFYYHFKNKLYPVKIQFDLFRNSFELCAYGWNEKFSDFIRVKRRVSCEVFCKMSTNLAIDIFDTEVEKLLEPLEEYF